MYVYTSCERKEIIQRKQKYKNTTTTKKHIHTGTQRKKKDVINMDKDI